MAGKAKTIFDYLRTWHGTPYDFDRFDFSHMGKGEGGQAYGWGGYSTSSEDVAKKYQRDLSARHGMRPELYIDDTPLIEAMPEFQTHNAREALSFMLNAENTSNKDLMMDRIERAIRANVASPVADSRRREDLHALGGWLDSVDPSSIRQKKAGHLYELGLDVDPEKMINWDLPLSEQPTLLNILGDQAQEVSKVINERRGKAETLIDMLGQKPNRPAPKMTTPESLTGKQLYRGMGEELDIKLLDSLADVGMRIDNLKARIDDTSRTNDLRLLKELDRLMTERDVLRRARSTPDYQTTQRLREKGVQGIQYLGEKAKSGTQGIPNFVSFNDDEMKILNKYLHPAALTGTGVMGAILGTDDEEVMY